MHVSVGSHIKKILWNYLKIDIYIEMELKSESEMKLNIGPHVTVKSYEISFLFDK